MKIKLIALVFVIMPKNAVTQNCDATMHCLKTIDLSNYKSGYFQTAYSKVDKRCFLQILDSLTPKNIAKNLTFISRYYSNIKKPPFIEDAIDSSVCAEISYHIADTNKYLAFRYRTYFTNTGEQYEWILDHNKRSREILRKYILSQNKEIEDWSWVKYVCYIRDSVAFWHAFTITKKNQNTENYARNFTEFIYLGMRHFNYYDLFEKNLDELIKIEEFGGSISLTIIDELPQKVNRAYAKKIYNKAVLNTAFMKRNSVAGALAPRDAPQDFNISIFNYNFIRGIELFYPELLKTKEYTNSCNKGYCFFDDKLYALLVKTIKTKK